MEVVPATYAKTSRGNDKLVDTDGHYYASSKKGAGQKLFWICDSRYAVTNCRARARRR